MTISTPVQLREYRACRKIVSTRDFDEDLGRMVDVCSHDNIRLYAQRGRWIHSPSAIKELARLERGGAIRW